MAHPLSLPAIAMGAITLFVGASHFVVWFRARRGSVDLTFALTCLCVALYDLACAGLYSAASPAEGAPWQRLQRAVLCLAGVAFLQFIVDYTGRLSRLVALGLSAPAVAYLATSLVVPERVFSTLPAPKYVLLGFGAFTYQEVRVLPPGYALEVFGAVLLGAALVAALRQLRAGDRERAKPLLIALAVLTAGVANDVGVALGMHRFVYTIEYAFMALVALMTFSLTSEVLRAERMERALAFSEARYRQLFEGTDDLVLQVGLEGKIAFANRGAHAALGLPPGSLTGMEIGEIIPPDESRASERSPTPWLGGRQELTTIEARHVTADDRHLDILWRMSPIVGPQGEPRGYSAIGRDISERKRDEERLRAGLERQERQQETILRLATYESIIVGNVPEAARRIAEMAADALRVARVGVWRVTADGGRIVCVDQFERSTRRHTSGNAQVIEGSAYFEGLSTDRAVVSHDALGDARLAGLQDTYLKPHGVRALIDAPVRMAGWLAGIVRIEQSAEPRAWHDDEIIFAGELADHMAQTIVNAERNKAEESLRASEARYRSMLEAMDDLMYICAADRRIEYMNPALIRRTGRDATGEACHRALHGLSTDCPWCATPALFKGDGQRREIVSPQDGRAYHISFVPLKNQDGSLSRMAIMRDITGMRQAESERELLTTAIEQVGEAVIITDTDAVIEYVNPAFERITGYSRAEALGQTPSLLKSGRHNAAFYRELWDAIRSGRTWSGRFINRRRDGTLFTEEAVISPVFDRTGRIASFVAVKRDVTAQVRLEEQLQQAQKMEAVGQLAGGVAHDFNNLLTPILGYAELLQGRLAPEDPMHVELMEICRAAEGARHLTDQLMTFSRRQALDLRVLDVDAVVAGMERLLRQTVRKDVEIVVARAPQPLRILGDATQIERVITNLAVNAQDAMPQGGCLKIAIGGVEIAPAEEGAEETHRPSGVAPGRYALLTIADNGVGMDTDTLTHCFEPFFTTKAKGKGTGLGLATVYGVVKQHGGEIRAESAPGQGAVFRIYLPVTQQLVEPLSGKAYVRRTQGGSETILVVEDDEGVRRLTCSMLRHHGYNVLAAEGGEEALAIVHDQASEIHLLLSDVVMPGMSGFEVADRLSRERPGLKVLFMSGHIADEVTPAGAPPAGIDLVAKPFSVETLTNKVREALDS
jgi:two-component system, cell cycle sensor histidine kinase and response regulator CckA